MAAPRKWRQLVELLAGLKIPSGAGVNKVLTSDAEGNGTWKLPGEASVAMAYRNAAQKIPNGAETQVKLDTVIKDPGGNISTANGTYIVPSDGYYSVVGEVLFEPGVVTTSIKAAAFIRVGKEKKIDGNWIISTITSNVLGLTVAGVLFCKKDEEIELAAFQEDPAAGAEKNLVTGAPANFLHVMRVGEGPPGATGPEGKAGPWTAPTSLGGKVEQGTGQNVEVRLENGGASARIKGVLKVKAAQELKPGEALCTLPASFRPPEGNAHGCTIMVNKVTAAELLINHETGVVSIVSLSVTSAQIISLDGVTWNVN